MNESAWPFSDPKNVAVFTVSDIMRGHLPILTRAALSTCGRAKSNFLSL
jgi:hypothetical protein